MKKDELNEEIAKHLGYKRLSDNTWSPPLFLNRSQITQVSRLPDFLIMIERYLRIEQIVDGRPVW